MRPLVIRLVRSPVKWLAPLLAWWLFWIDSELRRSGFPLWSEVAPSFLYSVLVLGPIAAAFAGLRAWAERRPSLSELTGTAVRDPAVRQAVAAAGDVLWVSAAQVIVAAVTLTRVALAASWGGPDWGMLLASFVALWACAALGWGAGWLVPTRVTGPLVGLALYFVMGVALSFDFEVFRRFLVLLPSGAPQGLNPPEMVAGWVGWLQVVWFGSIMLLGLGAAVALARRRFPAGWLGIGTVAAVVSAVILLQAPDRQVDPNAPLVCDQGTVEVCVHPAYESQLPELAEVIRATVAPLVEAEVIPARVVQDEYLEDESSDESAVGFSPHPDLEFVAENVALSALGDGYCFVDETGGTAYLAWDFTARWLVIQAGLEPPAQSFPAPENPPLFFDEAQEDAFERFETLGSDGRVTWLRDHYEALVACRVGIEEIG